LYSISTNRYEERGERGRGERRENGRGRRMEEKRKNGRGRENGGEKEEWKRKGEGITTVGQFVQPKVDRTQSQPTGMRKEKLLGFRARGGEGEKQASWEG
jgi:hypothetical protein